MSTTTNFPTKDTINELRPELIHEVTVTQDRTKRTIVFRDIDWQKAKAVVIYPVSNVTFSGTVYPPRDSQFRPYFKLEGNTTYGWLVTTIGGDEYVVTEDETANIVSVKAIVFEVDEYTAVLADTGRLKIGCQVFALSTWKRGIKRIIKTYYPPKVTNAYHSFSGNWTQQINENPDAVAALKSFRDVFPVLEAKVEAMNRPTKAATKTTTHRR
jgi:hypothetical protein